MRAVAGLSRRREADDARSLQDFELEFVRENLRVDDTKEYFRALQSEYMVPAGPVAPMILKTATQ